jgi:hypothetical protein
MDFVVVVTPSVGRGLISRGLFAATNWARRHRGSGARRGPDTVRLEIATYLDSSYEGQFAAE